MVLTFLMLISSHSPAVHTCAQDNPGLLKSARPDHSIPAERARLLLLTISTPASFFLLAHRHRWRSVITLAFLHFNLPPCKPS